MNAQTTIAAVSLAAIVAVTPAEALAAFADTDDLAVAAIAAEAAKGMAVCLSEADNAVGTFAKSYGQSRAVLQFARGVDGDSISANDKRAIGFDDLPATASAKRRLSQWHSRFRLIAERRTRPADADAEDKRYLSEAQLAGLYSGAVSFLTVYDNLVSADRAHKAAAKKLADAEADAATVTATEAPPATLSDMAMALAEAISVADETALAEAGDALALLLDAINGAVVFETSDETETVTEAVAA